MSLIEEALRRIQDPSMPKSSTTAAPPNPQATAQEPPPAHSWPITPPSSEASPPLLQTPRALNAVAAAILGLTVVLLLGGIVWLSRTRTGTRSAPEPAPSPAPAKASTPPISAPVQKPAWFGGANPEQEMILSGIVVGVGEPYAVINGEIVAQGDQIGSATLLDITPDSVTVRLPNGKEAVLKIPR